MLDTVYGIETPEGVDLDLVPSGPLPRILAWLVDFGLRLVTVIAVGIPINMLGDFGEGLFLITYFALEWLYPVLFEVLYDGSTPGKRLLDLRVVHVDGTPVSWGASVVRNLLRAADLVPGFYGVGFLSMLLSRRFARLGDLAAGTLVVYRHGTLEPQGGFKSDHPLPPPLPLRLDEQRAVISFAQRGPTLPGSRADELAAIPAPLIDAGPRDVAPAELLYGVGAWLGGRRPGKAP